MQAESYTIHRHNYNIEGTNILLGDPPLRVNEPSISLFEVTLAYPLFLELLNKNEFFVIRFRYTYCNRKDMALPERRASLCYFMSPDE